MQISVTTSVTPKQELPVPRSSQRPKLLGFSKLAQTVTPHLDLSRYDLELGPRKTWQQVVKEWREEQLAVASTRRAAVTERRRRLDLQRQEVREMRDRLTKTTGTKTITPRSTPISATAMSSPPPDLPRTYSTLTTAQCIDQLSELISPVFSRPRRTVRAHLAALSHQNCLTDSPITLENCTSTSPSDCPMDEFRTPGTSKPS